MRNLRHERDRAANRVRYLRRQHRQSRQLLNAAVRDTVASPKVLTGAFAAGFVAQRLTAKARLGKMRASLPRLLVTLRSLLSLRALFLA